ncbi:hypothetical protein QJS10_CPA08g01563 [Acorus calamus]|uniref:Uncharacterized protein n=1 Tax=Acorus calamus TaxID=4465 RepID=A0AAV9E7S5_ACOCL|nr:hypothetical protein QJS10_CPA08g01563 [Acorus calamus]
MADSTTTIDYLRARLLSERSVSSKARQRADELAKRVLELEEQLRAVTIQRRRAEKATAEALAILENHGVSDLSEACNSSSDQDDVHCVLKDSENSSKEENSTIRLERSEAGDRMSSSEVETSPNLGGGLSWKSVNSSFNSLEKKDLKKSMSSANHRHKNFLLTNGSSPKHNLGKSCRRIKRGEMGSGNDGGGEESVHSPENGDAVLSEDLFNHSERRPDISKGTSRNEEGTVHVNGTCSIENQNKEIVNQYVNGSDRDVEIALEKQAELIDRYQAEEDAQREWEENYRDNNNSTPSVQDLYEPGSQSDITEERNEPKVESMELVHGAPCYDSGTTIKDKQICISEQPTKNSSSDSPTDLSVAHDHAPEKTHISEAPITGSSLFNGDDANSDEVPNKGSKDGFQQFMVRNHENLHMESPEKQKQRPSENNPALGVQNFSKQEWSQIQYQHQWQAQPSKQAEDVLEALQRAKLSLKHKLERLPSPSQGAILALPSEAAKVPITCAGLFRLPESPSEELSSMIRYEPSNSGFSFFDPRFDLGQSGLAPNRYTYPTFRVPGPYMDLAREALPPGDQYAPSMTGDNRMIFDRQFYKQ